MNCSIGGCDSPHYAHGWCSVHYKRWRKYGDPLIQLRASPGSGTISHNGYKIFGDGGKDHREHVDIAERVLGRKLPPGAEVHHVNENPADNRNENLVICPSRAYHMLLHQRMRAVKACGNPDWRRCAFCKEYDNPQSMKFLNTGMAYHPSCRTQYRKQRQLLTGVAV